MPKTFKRRDNQVAVSCVYNALRHQSLKAFHNLSTSHCSHCRNDALHKFEDLQRRIRKMQHRMHTRSKSLPPPVLANPHITATPAVSRSASQPPLKQRQQPRAQPAPEFSTSSKKRRFQSEPPEAVSQQQAKKARKEDETAAEKSRSQSQKPAKRQPVIDEPLPTAPSLKKACQQQQSSSTEAPKTGTGLSKGKASKSSASAVPKTSGSWPSRVGKQKIKGLRNPSQWCYRRSVLQSLIAIPQLFNILEESHKNCTKNKCVTCAMRHLLISYHTSHDSVAHQLNALDTAIKSTGKTSDPRWSAVGQTQEDSHDFLQYLLGTIEKAKGIQKEQFDSLFHIKHTISWACDGCKKVHTHSDPPGFSLSLPVPKQGRVDITDCLNTYHREPNVTIRCDKCKKNAKRTRIFKIENAPDVLPIQLMRFGFGARGPTKNKLHVNFPEDLDLSRWAADKSKPLKYRLRAVVAHSGSLRYGHYIAYVRGPEGIKEISDSSVLDSDTKEWRRPTTGFDPYILVYVKQLEAAEDSASMGMRC